MSSSDKYRAVKRSKTKYYPFAIRFDDEDRRLLAALVSHHRLRQSDIIRIAIRRMAEDDLLGRKRG